MEFIKKSLLLLLALVALKLQSIAFPFTRTPPFRLKQLSSAHGTIYALALLRSACEHLALRERPRCRAGLLTGYNPMIHATCHPPRINSSPPRSLFPRFTGQIHGASFRRRIVTSCYSVKCALDGPSPYSPPRYICLNGDKDARPLAEYLSKGSDRSQSISTPAPLRTFHACSAVVTAPLCGVPLSFPFLEGLARAQNDVHAAVGVDHARNLPDPQRTSCVFERLRVNVDIFNAWICMD